MFDTKYLLTFQYLFVATITIEMSAPAPRDIMSYIKRPSSQTVEEINL